MKTHLGRGLALASVVLLFTTVQAAGPPVAGRAAARLDDVAELAIRIDRHIAAGLKDRKVVAAPLASDTEFVRRVYLDIAGRIPRVSEVREFLDDRRPDKRRLLVDKLLDGANYASHMTNIWRALLLPNNNNQQVQFLGGQIENWVRGRVRDNVPYDKMIRDLITTPIAAPPRPGRPAVRGGIPNPGDAGGIAFFQVNESKAENLAAATSRLFLGVKIECAQCHDHPFAKWTRKQFWEYTAFFAGVRPQNPQAGVFGGTFEDANVREISMTGSERNIQARFLDGKRPTFRENVTSRMALADWMTHPDNPFFARAAVNRLWEHFFGIGIVDPVDDFREDNPASHAELLDDLAKGLVAHKFDLKFVIRAITASQAYQRTSVVTDRSQEDLRAFARMPLKGLTPEQIFDSLATAVGYRGEATGARFVGGFGAGNTPRGEILTKFANPVDRRTEYQTTILQALALMNGRFIADATSLTRSETLAGVIDFPGMDTQQKLDTLYMAALARPMRGSEAGRLIPYVDAGGPSRDSKKALADVFWVLLNSSEFLLNH